MSILDQLLGGSDSESANMDSSDSSFDFATDPGLGFAASDILHSSSQDGEDGDSSEFTGIGDIGLGLSVPTFIGTSSSSDSTSYEDSDSDSGGLLGGLL